MDYLLVSVEKVNAFIGFTHNFVNKTVACFHKIHQSELPRVWIVIVCIALNIAKMNYHLSKLEF